MSRRWVACIKGRGRLHEGGSPERRTRKFQTNSIGLIVHDKSGNEVDVWLIGRNEIWTVPANEIEDVDVTQTGDKYAKKICNVCHCLLPVNQFARNQTNKHGEVRRPSCLKCRTNIDKRAPKSSQAKRKEQERPAIGTPFKCPICQRRSIAGITAKVVADHDHHTGNIRDFICDSCNTGLGRFKDDTDYLENAIEYLRERDALLAEET